MDEIRTVIGEKPRQITYDDLLDLKYLEMCIKETLRLFPIAPYIMRKVTEEFTIGKLKQYSQFVIHFKKVT